MKNKLITILSIIGLVVLFSSCEEEEKEHPKVQTQEGVVTSASSILFKGKIEELGDFKVGDYGFIYSIGSDPIEFGSKVSLDGEAKPGEFQKEVGNLALYDYWGPATIKYRSYITNELGTVYGQVLTLKLSSISMTGISPAFGNVGDIITINGENFQPGATIYEVYFNNTKAEIVDIQKDKIRVKVPDAIDLIFYTIGAIVKIKLGSYEYSNNVYFYILPTVTGLSPSKGNFGTVVEIYGSNFTPSTEVLVNGTKINYVNISPNSLAFSIPTDVTSETLKFKIRKSGQEIDVPGEFKIEPSVISSISPLNVNPGGYIFIMGKNLNGNNTIMIGDTQVYYYNKTSTSIELYLPSDFPVGSYTVTLSNGVHTVTATDKLTVVNP